MKLTGFILMTTGLLLVGCGEDAGSKRGRPSALETPNPRQDRETGFPSRAHKVAGAKALTAHEERQLLLGSITNPNVRVIPVRGTDDEGLRGRTRTELGRPDTVCGVDFKGLRNKLSDCEKKNKEKALWDGSNGKAGENSWRLVSLNQEGEEIWLDELTGMVWSDLMPLANWCQASGNRANFSTSDFHCQTLNPVSEDKFWCVDNQAPELSDFKWRLPTRNDFLQADLNGLRFVSRAQGHRFWTATMDSKDADKNTAWVYDADQGTLSTARLDQSRRVRCIGTIAN
jgi:hypothetical protein